MSEPMSATTTEAPARTATSPESTETGLIIAVLLMVLLGVTAMIVMT